MSLAACPFCGSVRFRNDPRPSGSWSVRCDSCGATGPEAASPGESMSKWDAASASRRLLRTVIDESPDIILMKDWDGRFILGNAALADLYGTTPEDLVGKDDDAFNPNREQVDFYIENVRSVMREGKTVIVEESSTNTATGETRYFHSIKKPLRGPDGEPRILVIAHDVTDLQNAYRKIEEREKSYSYAMAAAGEGIWDWDIPNDVVSHNPSWSDILGFPLHEMAHPVSVFMERLHEDDRGEVGKALENALSGDGAYHHEHRMTRLDGSVIWVLDRGKVVERDADGKPLRMAGSIVDIGRRKAAEQAVLDAKAALEKAYEALGEANAQLERKVAERTAELAAANEELRLIARNDALTGLPNRRSANERLGEEFARMRRTGQDYCVLMLDVDHFKSVNDTYGHDAGDDVLRAVGAIFSEALRETDFIARFGGEEFLAILPETGIPGAATAAEKVRSSVESADVPHVGRLTVSIGVAQALPDDPLPETAVLRADRKLYEAKEGGRNRVAS